MATGIQLNQTKRVLYFPASLYILLFYEGVGGTFAVIEFEYLVQFVHELLGEEILINVNEEIHISQKY